MLIKHARPISPYPNFQPARCDWGVCCSGAKPMPPWMAAWSLQGCIHGVFAQLQRTPLPYHSRKTKSVTISLRLVRAIHGNINVVRLGVDQTGQYAAEAFDHFQCYFFVQ